MGSVTIRTFTCRRSNALNFFFSSPLLGFTTCTRLINHTCSGCANKRWYAPVLSRDAQSAPREQQPVGKLCSTPFYDSNGHEHVISGRKRPPKTGGLFQPCFNLKCKKQKGRHPFSRLGSICFYLTHVKCDERFGPVCVSAKKTMLCACRECGSSEDCRSDTHTHHTPLAPAAL